MDNNTDYSKKFDIDYQFNFYLEQVKLNKEQMSLTQYNEIRQAFIAGISSMLVMNTEIGQMSLNQSAPVIQKLWGQCNDFWSNAVIKFQSKNN